MDRTLLIALFAFFFVLSFAPSVTFSEEIVAEPICFGVLSTAPHRVNGSIVTNYYISPQGVKARHRSNFRLDAAGAVDDKTGYKSDRAEFCTYGPFYPGRKLDFVIRTLVPVFSCRTTIEHGKIITIYSEKNDEGSTKMWADCDEITNKSL